LNGPTGGDPSCRFRLAIDVHDHFSFLTVAWGRFFSSFGMRGWSSINRV